MNYNNIKFRIYNKIFKSINFKSFNLAKKITETFIQSYNSNLLNQYKIDALKDNSQIQITTPSLKYLIKSIKIYENLYQKLPTTILDVGGSTGENAIFIEKIFNKKFDYYLVENQKLVELAKKNNFCHCKFISDIPKNQKFDLVFSSATLMYLDDPYAALKVMINNTLHLLSLARLNCSEEEKVKIQVSFFRKNIGYQKYIHKHNDQIALYPSKEISIKKIMKIMNNFELINEEILEDKMNYFIFKNNNI